MNRKEKKGKEIAKNAEIKFDGLLWIVPSESGKSKYQVNLKEKICSCPDYEKNLANCKHIYAAEEKVWREFKVVSSVNNGKQVKRRQTKRNWSGYNKSQMLERAEIMELLYTICDVPSEVENKSKRGPKPAALRDRLFSAVLKIYENNCLRHNTDYLEEAKSRGYLDKIPHYNSVCNYLKSNWLTPILYELVTISSLPLASLETSFSIDSSGFGLSGKKTWRDVKYGNNEQWHDWVKGHIICGNKTQIIISAVVSPAYKHDSPFFSALVNKTAKYFMLKEVLADAAYSSRANLELVDGHGAKALVAFKSDAVFGTTSKVWNKLLNLYKYHYDDFHERYRHRANVESAFNAVKSNFGESLRSRSENGQKNELLAKFICHNLRVLNRSKYEFDFDVDLSNFQKATEIRVQSIEQTVH